MIVGKGVASYFLGYLDELPPGGTHAPSGQHSLARNTFQDGLQAPRLVALWRGRRYVGVGTELSTSWYDPSPHSESSPEDPPSPEWCQDGL